MVPSSFIWGKSGTQFSTYRTIPFRNEGYRLRFVRIPGVEPPCCMLCSEFTRDLPLSSCYGSTNWQYMAVSGFPGFLGMGKSTTQSDWTTRIRHKRIGE